MRRVLSDCHLRSEVRAPPLKRSKSITLVFGLVMLLIAFFVDLRSRFSKDYAFWLYLFGLLGAGVWWSRNEANISSRLRAVLPDDLRELLEARTAS